MTLNESHEAGLALLRELDREIMIGHLAVMTRDGYPRTVPVNFALWREAVYFHGSLEGEKAEAFARADKLTFCVYQPLARTPSYWRSQNYACPASQYYRSVLIRGRGRMIEDVQEKAGALQALMEKHQPEGRFERIEPDSALYKKALSETAIFRIEPARIECKVKIGQSLSPEVRQLVVAELLKRNRPGDRVTAQMMKDLDKEGEHP